MQDAAFTTANKALDGLLKLRRKTGELKPTSHEPAILTADLEKIVQYVGYIGEHPAWRNPSSCVCSCGGRSPIISD